MDIVSRQWMSFMKLPPGATFPLPPKKNTLINNSKIVVNKNDGATHYLVFFIYLFPN